MANRWLRQLHWIALTALAVLPCLAQKTPVWKYERTGNAADATHVAARPGYALMGGGTDLDEAFQWLCGRAGGGDFLVLRATGTDAYNPYIRKLCPKLNSVATLIVPSREAAQDPEVARRIAEASGLFIAGGDQANYINFWMGTPVQVALNDAIARGVPIGGTSAGLAVMGEWAYSAQGDKPDDKDLDSKTVLADPYNPRITLVHGFLNLPMHYAVVTDSHFARRDRMGRLIAFLVRLNEPEGKPLPWTGQDRSVRGIGVEERTALLLEPSGQATVVGKGAAYFLLLTEDAQVLARGKPLTLRDIGVAKVSDGEGFDLYTWEGEQTRYTLSVKGGTLYSDQAGGPIY